jgi:hypothetical protein
MSSKIKETNLIQIQEFISRVSEHGRVRFFGKHEHHVWVDIVNLFGGIGNLPSGWSRTYQDLSTVEQDSGNGYSYCSLNMTAKAIKATEHAFEQKIGIGRWSESKENIVQLTMTESQMYKIANFVEIIHRCEIGQFNNLIDYLSGYFEIDRDIDKIFELMIEKSNTDFWNNPKNKEEFNKARAENYHIYRDILEFTNQFSDNVYTGSSSNPNKIQIQNICPSTPTPKN